MRQTSLALHSLHSLTRPALESGVFHSITHLNMSHTLDNGKEENDSKQHLENEEKLKQSRRISSFAVIDLETSNLPDYDFNKVSITEMSIYGFSKTELEHNNDGEMIKKPRKPRILHKLTLLFNPMRAIHPVSSSLTGLTNEMLEYETPFNENGFRILEGFLNHLPGPVCLVAHNGWAFDFPVIHYCLDKIKKQLSNDILCMDSFSAFPAIDSINQTAADIPELGELLKPLPDLSAVAYETIDDIRINNVEQITNENIDQTELNILNTNGKNWEKINETTPKRRRSSPNNKSLITTSNSSSYSPNSDRISFEERKQKFRRTLFPSPSKYRPSQGCKYARRRYPPKNKYRLGNIYERIFNKTPENAHHAEADVHMLMDLMLYYGNDFLAYAEEHAIVFNDSPRLGDGYR